MLAVSLSFDAVFRERNCIPKSEASFLFCKLENENESPYELPIPLLDLLDVVLLLCCLFEYCVTDNESKAPPKYEGCK